MTISEANSTIGRTVAARRRHDAQGPAMWARIAGAVEREAEKAPAGEDRDLALELAAGIRARIRPRTV